MTAAGPIFALNRFSYRYSGAADPALSELSLTIDPGEFVVVCGGSGSGKSTLLRVACGLVPHHYGGLVEGEAAIAGRDLRDHDARDLAAICGTLFQDPETQIVMGTVRAEIAFPLENAGRSPAATARGVEEVALALGVAELLDRSTAELSGGELQRVALAATLAPRPPLLVLDEPTSQLDPVAGDELVHTLRRLNEEWGVTVILAEHRLERCLAAADRVLAIAAGEIACDATPAGFLAWADRDPARRRLMTPAARMFSLAGLPHLPVSVKEARGLVRDAGLCIDGLDTAPGARDSQTTARPLGSQTKPRADDSDARPAAPALELSGVWFEHERGRPVLRGIDLAIAPGERVAVMGRNGAGKSTLLRIVKGLERPNRGQLTLSPGVDVGLLLQNPSDYILHDRVIDELELLGGDARLAALRQVDLERYADADPRDLSSGERQRLALAIVLQRSPAALLLDEPTRGLDRGRKDELAARLCALADAGAAVVVATHDPEFAARFARRVVLLGAGRVLADGPIAELLADGWYFSTEVARVLGGAGGALTPEDGALLLAGVAPRPLGAAVPDPLVGVAR